MSEFINWLNANQGLIALVAIIITIIGFFITNKNVSKVFQKSKSGDSSTTMQIGNINKEKND